MLKKDPQKLIQNLEFTVNVMEQENAKKVFNMNVSRTRDCIAILKDLNIENVYLTKMLRELLICKKEQVLTSAEEQKIMDDIIYLIKGEVNKSKNNIKAA